MSNALNVIINYFEYLPATNFETTLRTVFEANLKGTLRGRDNKSVNNKASLYDITNRCENEPILDNAGRRATNIIICLRLLFLLV